MQDASGCALDFISDQTFRFPVNKESAMAHTDQGHLCANFPGQLRGTHSSLTAVLEVLKQPQIDSDTTMCCSRRLYKLASRV